MLSAASDIMNRELNINETVNPNSTRCEVQTKQIHIEVDHRNCKFAPLGEVLLADIFPAFILKLTMPFFMDRIPFGIRHVFICVFQLSAYLTVGFSANVKISLLGVVFASISDGVGDVSYLSLSSHYPKYETKCSHQQLVHFRHMVSALCSGTGSAGLIGSFLYAFLTESNLVGLSPKTAILLMTIGPCFLFASYFVLLSHASTVHQITLSDPKTWLVPRKRQTLSTITPSCCDDDLKPATLNYMHHEVLSFRSKIRLVLSLLKYALPLAITFFFEYFAVESLTAFFVFDCAHGFNLSPSSQYRWFAVVYRLGGSEQIKNHYDGLNGVVFLTESLIHYLPHIYIALILLFFIGIIGGSNYCNTFYRIHKEVPSNAREFSLGFVSMADVFGILAAAFISIPTHNAICSHNKLSH
ncbi:Battenin [Aphelenchoides besseyi]|nr:Battenin [Aphelenchoides besseyi]